MNNKKIPNTYFLHIPKCAGNQLNKLFFSYGHRSILEIQKSNIYNEKLKIFTIVRNPYDRFISAYFYLKQNGAFDKKNKQLYNDFINIKSIEELILLLFNDFKKYPINFTRITTNSFLNIIHFRPMYTFVCDNELKLLVNDILKFENLEYQINLLFKKYNINKQFIKTNSSKRKHFMYYFNQLNKDYIDKFNEIYDSDFKLFNYKKI